MRAPPQAETTRHSRHLEQSVHPLQLRPSVNVRSRRPAEDCHDHLMHTEAHDDTRREELARWRRNRLFPDLMAQRDRGKLPTSNRRLGVKREPYTMQVAWAQDHKATADVLTELRQALMLR